MTAYPRMGVVRVTFLKFCSYHIFGIVEARHVKFLVLIDTHESWCMHDILLRDGCVHSHVTEDEYRQLLMFVRFLFSFRELLWLCSG